MKFKEGVLLHTEVTAQPICVEGMMLVSDVYRSLKITGTRARITSVCEGKHMDGSLHYKGLAFDTRTWKDEIGTQMDKSEKEALARLCRTVLPKGWEVLVRSTHLHLEYDPK